MIEEIVKIGIAEMKITKCPNILKTSGLGSCVGVVIFDSKSKLSGMAHIMLPYVLNHSKGVDSFAKYAETAVPLLISELIKNGACKNRMRAKIAGGASMFPLASTTGKLKIGYRNVEAIKELLEKHQILLVSEDTGGNKGRTIEFHSESSDLHIRTVSENIKII